MFFYGTSSIVIETIKSESTVCPNCKRQGGVDLSVHREHTHILLIPFFAHGKFGVADCNKCGYAMDESAMPPELHDFYHLFKRQVDGPIWQYAGTIVLLLLGITVLITSIIASTSGTGI